MGMSKTTLSRIIAAAFRAARPIRFASTNQRYPGTIYMYTGSVTKKRGRIPRQIGSGTLTELIVSMPNACTTNSGDLLNPNPYTITEAYIEDDSTGKLTPVTSGGQTSFTVPAGVAEFLCDPISCASLGYPSGVPRGTKLWFRYDATQSAGQGMPCSYNLDVLTGSAGYFWDPASGSVSAVNATGPMTKTGTVYGSGSTEVFEPIFLGRFQESSVISAIGVGDSLLYGSNYGTASAGWQGFGATMRSLYDSDGNNPIAGLVIARPGNTADDLMGSNTASWTYFKYATHGYEDLGTNDVGVPNGATTDSPYATAKSRKQAIWAGMRAAGIGKVATMILLPNTTSTDGYTTLANQTALAEWGVGGRVESFRDWLNAQVGVVGGVDTAVQFSSVRWAGARWAWASAPDNSYHWGKTLQDIAAPELRTFWLS